MARRHHVGFHNVIVSCRAFRTVACLGLTGRKRSSIALGGSDGKNEGIVARSRDGSEAVAAIDAESSIVACSDYDYDSALPGCFNRLTERVLCVADRNSAAQR